MNNFNDETLEIKTMHGEMERKCLDILLHKRQNVDLTSKEKMAIYSKVNSASTASREESQWLAVNEDLYLYYRDRVQSLMATKKKDMAKLKDKPFLMEMQKTWNVLKTYIRWIVTMFLPIEKYTAAYKPITLIQAALDIIKEELVLPNVKEIRENLFIELQKERNHDAVDLVLNQDTFNYFLIVDYGKDSKIMMQNGRFEYNYTGTEEKQNVEAFEKHLLERLKKDTKEFYSKFVHDN
jgi:hypothetical protein